MKKVIKRILKYFLFTIIALVVTVNLFIVLSGRFYIYKGIANTYMVGNIGPSIYDLDVFPYSTIKAPKEKSIVTYSSNFNTYKLSKADRKYIEDLETTAFLVYKGNTLVYEEYWDEHNAKTVSNSFSVAKTVVSMLIGIAVEDGDIKSLDDPIHLYLKELKSKETGKITVRDLLTMSSGLDWTESGKNPLSDNAESYYGEDLRRLVMGQNLISKPGKVFKYQSGNSQLLGFIVESATGKDLSKYAQEKLWSKLGMEHDSYWSLDKKNGDEKAFCCLYSVARDYGRIGQLFVNKGKCGDEQIIPEWYFKEMNTLADLTTEDGIPNYRYGLHTWYYNEGDNEVNYCRGVSGQYIISRPKEDLLIIRLGKKRAPDVKIADYNENPKKISKYKVGHPTDLFEYLRIGKAINLKSESK
jgi:CubicO group peptidase (beta-lactamase class C family)